MKKKCTMSIALVVGYFCAFAQPAIGARDFPINYSADVYIISRTFEDFNVDGVLSGNPSINQVWDFSTLTLPDTPNGTYTVVPVTEALNNAYFPSANYCVKSNYMVLTGGNYIYQMYNISPKGLVFLGNSSDAGVNVCRDNYDYFPLPYLYNTTISGTHNCDVPFPYEFASKYDAYGTVITPFGFYQDVIRKKTVSNDSFKYTWIRTKPFSILMEANLLLDGSNNVEVTVFKETTELKVAEVNKEKAITVYPNPSSYVLNIKLFNENAIDEVVVTDLAGKIILHQNHDVNQVNVQSLSRGLYVLQVFSENEKYQAKFIKE